MMSRPFWQQRIEEAWRETPIVWLAGVRRSGKTTLAESFGGERALYMVGIHAAPERWTI
jgi:predicted AAA+ superfamily ATPase